MERLVTLKASSCGMEACAWHSVRYRTRGRGDPTKRHDPVTLRIAARARVVDLTQTAKSLLQDCFSGGGRTAQP